MKITDIKYQIASFQFTEPFKVAFAVMTGYDTLVIKMETDEGICGWGEAAPLGFVTGDDLATAKAVLERLRGVLIGQDPLAIRAIHAKMDALYAHNTAVKAAVDIACYDIAAKRAGLPLYRYLGGECSVVESDVTLGIGPAKEMAEKAADWAAKGFGILKVKLGEDISTDIERMRQIRAAVGPDVKLRVDANQGWSPKDAARIAKELERLDVELIEQPVAYWDLAGLGQVTRASGLPVVADESCHLPCDAAKLAAGRLVDGVNIKLMKCGGIHNALKISAVAEANGLPCMIGCMGESRIAITAGMHLAAACANIKKVDLDVCFYTKSSWIRDGFTNEGGVCTLSEKPGLGVTVDWV